MGEKIPIEYLIDLLTLKIKSLDKFVTYVTKTHPHSSTYSRKPENYNGTNIFEIDIMKKSSPIN